MKHLEDNKKLLSSKSQYRRDSFTMVSQEDIAQSFQAFLIMTIK